MFSDVDLYEYQARDMFEAHGVPVLQGIVADTPAQARAAAEKIGGTVVVKAQVQTGGRGKAGGVKVVHNPEDAEKAAEAILGLDIKGHIVKRVMVAEGAKIDREFYFSVLLDRANRSYLSLCSVEGGMDIEQLAEPSARRRSRRSTSTRSPASTSRPRRSSRGRAASPPTWWMRSRRCSSSSTRSTTRRTRRWSR